MKWIVYLLILLNIAMFVWHYRPGDGVDQSSLGDARQDEATLSLVLLKEQRQQKDKEITRWCFSLGPFENKQQASLATGILKSAGINADRRLSTDARRKAYWVLLPPAESREAAQKSIARLKQLKVTDYFLVATGEKTNAVSLGVYSQFESAHRRIKEMQDMGFKPDFEKVELPKREYWLDWPRKGGKPLPEEDLKKVQKISDEVRQIERGCG
jgi:hypothetical protein